MHFVTSVYSFFTVPNPADLSSRLKGQAAEWNLQGLLILAPEGLNGTFSTPSTEAMARLKSELRALTGDPDLTFKDSQSEKAPFHRFTVKIRREIVSLGAPELSPTSKHHHHLSPDQWDEVLRNEPDVLLIDTRNDYEYGIGTFPGAVNPHTRKFSEFPDFMRQRNIPPDKKVLIFCTGGIRCEKGILELERQGYRNVYQLDGGILNYLERKPDGLFKGECLVFDQRVALDHRLAPSQTYTWCPHCGNPAPRKIVCARCQAPAQICDPCAERIATDPTCSKNCRNILEREKAKASTKESS